LEQQLELVYWSISEEGVSKMYDLFDDDLFGGFNYTGTAPNTNFRIVDNVFEVWDVGTSAFREVYLNNGAWQVT
jgi:hypothetical protein